MNALLMGVFLWVSVVILLRITNFQKKPVSN